VHENKHMRTAQSSIGLRMSQTPGGGGSSGGQVGAAAALAKAQQMMQQQEEAFCDATKDLNLTGIMRTTAHIT
jgi:hypothetical protein